MVGRISKTITAATAAVLSLGALAVDGYTTEEKYAAVAIILGVVGVYFIPNAPGGEPPLVGAADDGDLP